MSKKPTKHISMKPMLSDPIDPAAVVSSAEMTGMFAMMPEAQVDADLLMDLGMNAVPIVPEMGDDEIPTKRMDDKGRPRSTRR